MGVAVHYFFFSIFLWAVTWGHSWTTMMWLRVWIRLWLCGSGIRRSQAIQPRGGSMSRRNLPPISTRKLTRKEWWRWKGKLRTPITWLQWVHILKTRNWSLRNRGCPPCLEIVFSHFLILTSSWNKRSQVMPMGKFGPTAINFGEYFLSAGHFLGTPCSPISFLLPSTKEGIRSNKMEQKFFSENLLLTSKSKENQPKWSRTG